MTTRDALNAHGTTAEIFARVAPFLGDGWTARPHPDGEPSMGGYLDGPDGATLHAYGGYQAGRTDRLAITGYYPDDPTDGRARVGGSGCPWLNPGPDAYQARRHSITVRKDRTPEAIAREIHRRLLPDYLADLAGVLEADRRTVAAAGLQADRLAELGDVFKLTRPQADGLSWYTSQGATGYGDVRLYSDGSQGSLELKSAPFATIRAVLVTLAAVREAELAEEQAEMIRRAETDELEAMGSDDLKAAAEWLDRQ